MLKALLIDDESSALDALADELVEYDEVDVVGSFTNVFEALRWIEEGRGRVDVAFLDIEMPGINGLEAAERVLELDASIHIVFVTAYNQYAVEAFEVNAVDYLLKPVMTERLEKTIRNRLLTNRRAVQEHGSKCSITCFGSFQLQIRNAETQAVKWRTNKMKELFAYFVHFKGEELHKSNIIRDVFPDLDEQRAVSSLHTSVYLIRKLIREHGLDGVMQLHYTNDCYRLELSGADLDVDVLRDVAKSDKPATNAAVSKYERAVALYRGDYLGIHNYIWAVHEQHKLRHMFLKAIERLCDTYRQEGKPDKAIEALAESAVHNPLLEELHVMLLTAYGLAGKLDELERHYSQMKKLIREELGAEPQPAAEAIYRRWMRK